MNKLILALSALLLLLTACSEHTNDEKYRSDCPRFASMQISSEVIRVGTPVTFTCVERQAGKLLDRTTYNWTALPAENVNITITQPEGCIYDGANPSCTFAFPQPGTYTITFQGDYKGSGQVNYFETTEMLDDGETTARYSANTSTGTGASRDYLHAVLTRRVVVVY